MVNTVDGQILTNWPPHQMCEHANIQSLRVTYVLFANSQVSIKTFHIKSLFTKLMLCDGVWSRYPLVHGLSKTLWPLLHRVQSMRDRTSLFQTRRSSRWRGQQKKSDSHRAKDSTVSYCFLLCLHDKDTK